MPKSMGAIKPVKNIHKATTDGQQQKKQIFRKAENHSNAIEKNFEQVQMLQKQHIKIESEGNTLTSAHHEKLKKNDECIKEHEEEFQILELNDDDDWDESDNVWDAGDDDWDEGDDDWYETTRMQHNGNEKKLTENEKIFIKKKDNRNQNIRNTALTAERRAEMDAMNMAAIRNITLTTEPQTASDTINTATIRPFTNVKICSLVKTPQYNGMIGILGALDKETGRYRVQLKHCNGKIVNALPQNIEEYNVNDEVAYADVPPDLNSDASDVAEDDTIEVFDVVVGGTL